MRVLLISKTYPQGPEASGTGAMAQVIAEGLTQRGHEVVLLASRRNSDGLYHGVRVRGRLIMDRPDPTKAPSEWGTGDKVAWIQKARHNYATVRREIRRHKPDIVYLNDIELLTGSVFAACLDSGVRCIWHAHDYILHDMVERNSRLSAAGGLRRLLAHLVHDKPKAAFVSTPVIAVSHFIAGRLMALGWPTELVTVVHNGLPEYFFGTGRRTPPPAENWPLLFVGRCVEEKGVGLLLQVLAKLRQQGIVLPLMIVGSFRSERAAEQYLQEAERLGVREQIMLRGLIPREGLPAVYREAGCLLAPSLCPEAFGLMSAEAQACGTPVVVSRVGGLPETLDDGKTGFVCASGDSDAMAERIAQLYVDRDLWVRMSEGGKEFAKRSFASQEKIDDIESILTRWVDET